MSSGTCRVCGCTDRDQCHCGCCWVDDEHTLCSACLPLAGAADREASGVPEPDTVFIGASAALGQEEIVAGKGRIFEAMLAELERLPPLRVDIDPVALLIGAIGLAGYIQIERDEPEDTCSPRLIVAIRDIWRALEHRGLADSLAFLRDVLTTHGVMGLVMGGKP